MIIYFNLPFEGKKGSVIKEAVANKKDRQCSTPILGQFSNKICFDVLISYITPMGDVFTIHCERVKNVSNCPDNL